MLNLRLRLPNSAQPVDFPVEASTPWGAFLYALESRSGIEKSCLRVLIGYPRLVVDADDNAEVGTVLRGENTLFLQKGEATVVRGVSTGRYIPPANERWHFTRRVCPSDNSCLFHAAAYVLRNKSRTDGPLLRQECANVVQSNPEFFTELLLERPNHEYVEWIRRPTTWGGSIELFILSFLEHTEIIALDLESCRMERIGENMGYTVMTFVVYTGQHYDAIAMNAMYNSPREDEDQVIFNAHDDFVIARAERFVREEVERMKQSS
ncbi:ubiquitin thioesterase OTU1 [Trypanosoma grayi]|uniref:ubiquitin thioesterase OTU1 n=1 Tax=Trypanosoma grayi TaxID=71804 RepID=UPI0004F415AA|nr:ubiquitin thioesterase OTU1 [Trypanosoma grayi]KEG14674.1 ubiquitin thioesterase OTU1 [Trypanosoma grayi]